MGQNFELAGTSLPHLEQNIEITTPHISDARTPHLPTAEKIPPFLHKSFSKRTGKRMETADAQGG